MTKLPRLVAARPGTVLALCLVVTAVALLPATRVRFVTDLASLLPEGSQTVSDYRVFLEHFGGFEKVFVLIEHAGDGAAEDEVELDGRQTDLAEAATLLAERLAASPRVTAARAGVSASDERFFFNKVAPRAALLLGEEWLDRISTRIAPQAIKARAAEIRATLLSPTGGFKAPLLRSDPLGFFETSRLSPAAGGAPIDPLTMTFLSADGLAALVIVTPATSEIDPEAGRALLADLDQAYAAVRDATGLPLTFAALGGPLYAAQDERIIREDLQRTVSGSVVGCGLVLAIAFEGVLLPAAFLAALALGLVWTAGLIGLFLGQISAVGIGFAAVLVGLGLDYGIHGCARFRDALLATRNRVEAMAATFRHAGPGILTSAVTTAAAFLVLSLAHFVPLRELGLVVAVGIVAILLASASAGAAAVVLAQPRTPRPPGAVWRLLGAGVCAISDRAARHPRPVLVAAAIASMLAAVGVCRLGIDADPRALRPANHPANAAEQQLVKRFGIGTDTATVVVPGADLSQALLRARRVEAQLRDRMGDDVHITSPTAWLAGEAAARERLAVLARLPLEEAADQLEQELRQAGLNPRAFAAGLEALRGLGRGEDPGAPPPDQWPDWLRELVRVGPEGVRVAIRLRLAAGVWPDGPPQELGEAIREAAPGTAIAAATALGDELRNLARDDLARLSLWALLTVMVVVLASFRGRPLPALLASVPVLLGSLWTLGFWGMAGQTIDLVSLAVLPILLGIGIDDGLHAMHGCRRSPATDLDVAASVATAGRAMALTTLTTCVGFGSLTLSRIPGLRLGGLLVAAGVLLCLIATLAVLPALGSVVGTATSSRS